MTASSTGNGPALAYGFTGREQDASGLNYHRDRYVDPRNGRWQQPDRLGMVDGPNVYGYARANPVQFRDPMGQLVEAVFWRDRNLLEVWDLDTDSMVTMSAVSGGRPFGDPIPPGEYEILETGTAAGILPPRSG